MNHKCDPLHAELAEIDENIQRTQLTALEEAQALKRRKEIYEELHPTVANGKTPGNQHTGQHRENDILPFSQDAAKQMGKSRRTVERAVKTANDIAEDVQDDIADLPIANNASELKKLSAMPHEKQRAVAKRLKAGEADADPEEQGVENSPPLTASKSRDELSELFDISGKLIDHGAKVLAQGTPELIADVERGDVAVSSAAMVADLPEEQQREAVAEGKRGVAKAAKEAKATIRSCQSGNIEWYTPSLYVEAARQVMGSIDLDPASCEFANQTVNATAYYSVDTNGLATDWRGNVWLNPPYSAPLIGEFIDKLVTEYYDASNLESAVLLTNNATDTNWWHKAASSAHAICFTKGRIKFYGEDGEKGMPPNGQTFFYFGSNVLGFAKEFEKFGCVVDL